MHKLVGTNQDSFDCHGNSKVKKLPWKTWDEYDSVYDTSETIYPDDFFAITGLNPANFPGEYTFTEISGVAIAFNMDDGLHYFYMKKG